MLIPDWPRHAATAALIGIMGNALTACSSAPHITSQADMARHIQPSAHGFVVCAGCDNFEPTPKHIKTPAPATVPVTLTIPPVIQSKPVDAVGTRASVPAPQSVSITILFRIGQSHIGPIERKKLLAVLQTASANSAFVITGYTDATGSAAGNKRLAGLRATVVKDVVTRVTHSARVSINAATSCCDDGGTAKNPATNAERAKHRRVEMDVLYVSDNHPDRSGDQKSTEKRASPL
jgi:outer membrane protein OmpA-like peptidoglycan-associated protein